MDEDPKKTDESTEEPTNPGRRDVMTGAIAAALGGVALVSSGGPAAAVENKEGDHCLTVLFPNKEGGRFDIDYYVNHHIPLVLSLYGDSVRNYEVFKPVSGMGNNKPPFVAMANIWITDQEAYNEASKKARDVFSPDVPHFTDIRPTGQTNMLYKIVKPKK